MPMYDWPKGGRFGRVVPKSKIYEHAKASNQLKELFIRDVERIEWAYKLAPETLNLSATERVTEVQVFELRCHTANLHQDILRAIDRAIPFPLIFELQHGGKTKMAAAHKRRSEADSTKWVLSDYFESPWSPDTNARAALPVALNLERLYEALLQPLVATHTSQLTQARRSAQEKEATLTGVAESSARYSASLCAQIEQAAAIEAQTREIKRIQARLSREKQFNKRVAINAELREAQQELERLSSSLSE
ncbi:hypothetical protein ATO7_05245 [Oceanococcus atlanticus]|uniref:Methyl-accepting chemotaxis protein n=1 Tax=Oceanococcus atlanticus TaxID=1317117 RepID=A0A1Y1SI51_9GAMM|nr:DUF4391 domain-containing protein [Oceanococcus atlanticus]ORE89258.1 hypothetical protein ATO7_05245 [Oceanococcus atlanticus]